MGWSGQTWPGSSAPCHSSPQPRHSRRRKQVTVPGRGAEADGGVIPASTCPWASTSLGKRDNESDPKPQRRWGGGWESTRCCVRCPGGSAGDPKPGRRRLSRHGRAAMPRHRSGPAGSSLPSGTSCWYRGPVPGTSWHRGQRGSVLTRRWRKVLLSKKALTSSAGP